MKLPEADRAVVPEAKVTGYLLAEGHPEGRGKAAFFQRYGFTPARWSRLADALLAHARAHEVARAEPSPFGTRYVVEGTIETPSGRTPFVRTVWFIEAAGSAPRFVTAYPFKPKP